MAKRSLNGSIDKLPVFEEAEGFHPVFELAMITYKPTPQTKDSSYCRQRMGGVMGRDAACTLIYFAKDLFLINGVTHGWIAHHGSSMDIERIQITELDDYEIKD